MEALPAAAAQPGAAQAKGASAEPALAPEAGCPFPRFVGHRRPLPPDAELFESGNAEREELARQSAVDAVRDERRQLGREAGLAADPLLADHRFECHQCHASLPTARLLDIHVSEMHDSFFAAQAARRMPVFLCLVDGCSRKFCTVEERKQHLQDHHRFPRHFHFDRMHLRRKKAQVRPLPGYQKGHGRQAMAAETAAPAGAGADQQPPQQQQGEQAAAAAQQGSGEELAAGLSRLSMAAEDSSVPAVIHFGRQGRGRGLAGRGPGRGGRGGRGSGGAGAQGSGSGGGKEAPAPAAGEAT